MRKTVQIGISSLLIGFFIGCAAMTPENSFYDSKIRSIEVDAVKIENQFSDEMRMEEFAKYIIIELNKKGYDTIKGNIDVPTFIEGFSPDGYAKKNFKKNKS